MKKQLTPDLQDAARVCAAQYMAKDGTRPVRVKSKLSPTVVFLFTSPAGWLCVLSFEGRSTKPAARYRFPSEQRRREWVERYLADSAAAYARVEQRKAERKADAVRKLEKGDVLRCSWGYDQTNVDYYEVTDLVGDSMVEIRKIAAMVEDTGRDQGVCVPQPGNYIDEPMRKRAQGDTVRIYSFAYARRVTPSVVAGVKVFSADHWSSYA